MIPLDTLIRPMTKDEVLTRFIELLELLGLPASGWQKGGALRTILAVLAIVYSEFTVVMSAAIRSGFLDLAEGPWLTLLAYYVYGVDRKPPTYATGAVTLTNTKSGIFDFTAEELHFLKEVNPTTKKAYINIAPFTLGPFETKTIDVKAVEVGSSSSAAPGEINQTEVTLIGVTVSNALSVYGADEETDPELRQRCRDKLGTFSIGGVRGAYAYAVTSAKRLDGTFVNINRSSVSEQSSKGVVTVYVAAPSGAPTVEDLGFCQTNVEAIARPCAVTANVLAVTNVPLSRDLIVWARRINGVSAADIKNAVNARLAVEMRIYPIGGIKKPPSPQGYLYADFIDGVCQSAHSTIFDIDGSGADLALNPGEVAVLSSTVEVRLVGEAT